MVVWGLLQYGSPELKILGQKVRRIRYFLFFWFMVHRERNLQYDQPVHKCKGVAAVIVPVVPSGHAWLPEWQVAMGGPTSKPSTCLQGG